MSNSKPAELKLCYMLEQPGYPLLPKSENAEVRSISREDLAWLAGIVDGEGNIDFSVQVKKTPRGVKNAYFCPKVRISNTDMRMVKRISEIYVFYRLVFFYHFANVKNYANCKDSWKNAMHISISSQGSIKKILELIAPFLVNKQRQAELLIETITWVQAQPYRGRMSKEGVNYCENPEFHALLDRLKAERAFHVEPSTTIRKAQEILLW